MSTGETKEAKLMAKLMRLTPAGRRWAEDHASSSMVARVALYGAGDWPEAHVTAAIKVANEEGSSLREVARVARERKAGRA